MPRQRPVASLATDAGVFALALFFRNLGMAGFASLAAGKLDWPRADVIQGARPEVPVLAELLGDDGAAEHEEHKHASDK